MPIDMVFGLTEIDETVAGFDEPDPDELPEEFPEVLLEFAAPPEQPANNEISKRVHAHQNVFIFSPN